MRYPLNADLIGAWRTCIEGLAGDFLKGRADVDPREYPDTCEKCGLQTLCRILPENEGREKSAAPALAEAADE